MLLLGGVTSLPEVAAVSTSAASGNAPLSISNLLGTVSTNVLLISLADAMYRGGPVLAGAGPFEVIGAVLMTGMFVIGPLRRRNRTVLRVGYDGLAAILLFASGLALLARAIG